MTLYLMCLFLEMLWVKKCRNLMRGIISLSLNIFLMPKIWNYFFCSTAFVDKIIRGNIILFYQLVVSMGKYLLEMLWVKKCNLMWGNISLSLNIFLVPKIWNYFFCSTAFVDKIIRGNISLFYQLVVSMVEYLPQ